jgi:hypothetical protein
MYNIYAPWFLIWASIEIHDTCALKLSLDALQAKSKHNKEMQYQRRR